MWMDRLIARVAEAQHGVVARRQLLGLGLTREAIQVRIEAGRLLPLHHGVYAVGHRRLTREGRWMGATLALGEGAVLSHRSAAALCGLLDERGPADVSSPRNARPREGIAVHRLPSLTAPQCTRHRGIPCTTVARTLLDLAATARAATVKKAVKEAELKRLFDLRAIEAVEGGHHGRRRLRAVLEELSIGSMNTNSELEDRFLALVVGAGLPRPEINAAVGVGDETYFVDFLWRDCRLVVETNGFAAHAREASFYADSRRALRLRTAGFEVLTFTWPDVTQTPADVVAAVRARL
jgi:predicted transcriptional regulator of viral defense system